jgi:hypothetical protein
LLFFEPQTPLTERLAVQVGEAPLFAPAQVQVQGPDPETTEAVPAKQRLEEGIP